MDVEHGLSRILVAVEDGAVAALREAFALRVGGGRQYQLADQPRVFGLQVVLSRWWLSRYRFGPMEWLWRWLTYGRRPTMQLVAG